MIRKRSLTPRSIIPDRLFPSIFDTEYTHDTGLLANPFWFRVTTGWDRNTAAGPACLCQRKHGTQKRGTVSSACPPPGGLGGSN
jgi:hypothetical protein